MTAREAIGVAEPQREAVATWDATGDTRRAVIRTIGERDGRCTSRCFALFFLSPLGMAAALFWLPAFVIFWLLAWMAYGVGLAYRLRSVRAVREQLEDLSEPDREAVLSWMAGDPVTSYLARDLAPHRRLPAELTPAPAPEGRGQRHAR